MENSRNLTGESAQRNIRLCVYPIRNLQSALNSTRSHPYSGGGSRRLFEEGKRCPRYLTLKRIPRSTANQSPGDAPRRRNRCLFSQYHAALDYERERGVNGNRDAVRRCVLRYIGSYTRPEGRWSCNHEPTHMAVVRERRSHRVCPHTPRGRVGPPAGTRSQFQRGLNKLSESLPPARGERGDV